MKYKNIDIRIISNVEESKQHLEKDYETLQNKGIDNIIKEQFISWLLGDLFKEKSIDKVFDGLKIYDITYNYGKISENYSPTGEENYFGQFQFCFESCSKYTNDIFDVVAMNIYILNNSIVKVDGYDI